MTGPAAVSVPVALIFDPSLSDGALIAYVQLVRYAQLTGSATFALSDIQLGVLMGRSARQAARRVRELEDRGLLAVCRRSAAGWTTHYTVRDPFDIPGMPP